MVEEKKSTETADSATVSAEAIEPVKPTLSKVRNAASDALQMLAGDIDQWPMTQAARMADDIARAIAAIQVPQIGATFALDELSRSLAAMEHSRMFFQIPEVHTRMRLDVMQLITPIPPFVSSYRDPFLELVAEQRSASEKYKAMLTDQMLPALLESWGSSIPRGLAHIDTFSGLAFGAANRVPDASSFGANLGSLGVISDFSQLGIGMEWAAQAKAGLLGLENEADHVQTMMAAATAESATYQRHFESLKLDFSAPALFPFQDWLPDLRLDPELTSFLSLRWMVEQSLIKLIGCARFYRSRMPKNSKAWQDLSALIAKLEYYLEHLDTLEMLPASVFGNLNTLAAHAMHDLFQIHRELPAIANSIDSLADYWRY